MWPEAWGSLKTVLGSYTGSDSGPFLPSGGACNRINKSQNKITRCGFCFKAVHSSGGRPRLLLASIHLKMVVTIQGTFPL